jgi:hypothetical protein
MVTSERVLQWGLVYWHQNLTFVRQTDITIIDGSTVRKTLQCHHRQYVLLRKNTYERGHCSKAKFNSVRQRILWNHESN